MENADRCVQGEEVVFLPSLALDRLNLYLNLLGSPRGGVVGRTGMAAQLVPVLNNELDLIHRQLA